MRPRGRRNDSYQIPTFKLNGNLVHFAAFKDHIGFFPTSSPREAFKKELAKYKGGRGTIQFPYERTDTILSCAKNYEVSSEGEPEREEGTEKMTRKVIVSEFVTLDGVMEDILGTRFCWLCGHRFTR